MAQFVGMDPETARVLCTSLKTNADKLAQARAELGSRLANTSWLGDDSGVFRDAWQATHAPALVATAQTLTTLATQLDKHITEQLQASDGLGGGSNGGGAGEGGRGGGDRRSTNPGDYLPERDERNPDGRDGRRVRNDRLPGDRDGSDNFSNDWAGRAILARYLTGGPDWHIDNDPTWTQYMTDNAQLTHDMSERNDAQAALAVQQYLATGDANGSFNESFSQSIENGEGIVGYQYLHGTNADVGGFQHSGSTQVTPRADGTYEVRMNVDYRWNDIIDPNPQYSTDRWKSKVAEILTLGAADPYSIHIGWGQETTLIVDAQGNVISGQGWPR